MGKSQLQDVLSPLMRAIIRSKVLKLKSFVLSTLVIAILLVVGCEKKDDGVTPAPPATSKAVYILNGLGKTLSVIDLNTNIVRITSRPSASTRTRCFITAASSTL